MRQNKLIYQFTFHLAMADLTLKGRPKVDHGETLTTKGHTVIDIGIGNAGMVQNADIAKVFSAAPSQGKNFLNRYLAIPYEADIYSEFIAHCLHAKNIRSKQIIR